MTVLDTSAAGRRRLSSTHTDDELFDLAERTAPSDTNAIGQGMSFVLHSTYSGGQADPQMTPVLVLLILSPPNERLPPHGMVDRGSVRVASGGSGMQHICGITAAHFAPGRGLKVIKIFEEEALTD
eukprot:1693424-Pyramimonas_sp.AAC.1